MFWKEACGPPVARRSPQATYHSSRTDLMFMYRPPPHPLHKMTSQPKADCLKRKRIPLRNVQSLRMKMGDPALTTPISDKHFLSPHSFR